MPLLTEAVEEIEAVAVDPASGEGEPSIWLDFEESQPSVIGDAPDSIAIVPPVDLRRQPPAPAIEELDDLDEELAAAVAAAPREDETLRPRAAEPPAPSPAAPPPAAELRALAVIAGGAAALLHGEPVVAVDAAPTPAFPSPAQPASPPAVPDAAHWEAMAEEIRMQVLQRIDLFTDTGLRTQLGERLQPIVDRASADLVATINQHVGELLRAYVAEAIEREIDSWRRNH